MLHVVHDSYHTYIYFKWILLSQIYMSMYIWPASVTGLTMTKSKVCASAEFDVTSILKGLTAT